MTLIRTHGNFETGNLIDTCLLANASLSIKCIDIKSIKQSKTTVKIQ